MATLEKNITAFSSASKSIAINTDGFSDVSLLSIGEVAGHGMKIDQRSLETALEVHTGKVLKAFNNHCHSPAASEVIGMFSGLQLDAKAGKLRASTFRFLDSFKQHREAEYDTLVELANEHPEQFGVSLKHQFNLVWVMKDGSEINAFNDWLYGNPAPDGSSDELPFVRFKSLLSADFVDRPATNDGLFATGSRSDGKAPLSADDIKAQYDAMPAGKDRREFRAKYEPVIKPAPAKQKLTDQERSIKAQYASMEPGNARAEFRAKHINTLNK